MSTSDFPGTRPFAADRAFSITRRIRFGQTDPAGIVYYPNYFDMFNEIVEDWFADELGMSFRELHQGQNMGIPLVHTECDFIAPCRLGEPASFSLRVTHLGRTSIHVEILVTVEGDLRLRAKLVLVFVDVTNYRSVAPPENLLASIAKRMTMKY